MGQADIQQSFSPASVDGFDQIYQSDPVLAQSASEQAQPDPVVEVETGPEQAQIDPTEGICLEEAAKILGFHIDTVRKRLQKGKIKGFKAADKFGDKWLVYKDEVDRLKAAQPHPMLQAKAAPEQAQTDPVVEVETGPDQDQIDPTPKAQTDPERDRLLSIIESQAHQLKAAGDVIIYLRSQVDEKDTQLKLLTDSQHKQGWWARFSSWFTGH